ncbi:group 1 glycosyl transferase [Anabaenopsis circularis NIES-21]|uniref:Group 1 glycosyl transferase n=1 Tax=Anabaenopsis circularis NIES-21 TaxID=1085406 RepID=A0A1Z4GNL8_9CYAN|nr:group 1 glycosyl transferase [Anabaenopsis circularis NIES-21]
MSKQVNNSSLDNLIPPEISEDELYKAIQKLASEANIKTVLEIGSSSGGGSTAAFVQGINNNPHQPTLYCMEVSKNRFGELQKRYADNSFVKCYNVSSIDVGKFPDKNEVVNFYYQKETDLKKYPLEQVLLWLEQDIEYVKSSGVSGDGIKKIKEENNIDYFDIVLIDGSEFTGSIELDEVYGANFIILDDINTFKNFDSHQRLLRDPNYTLVHQNIYLRNGYSIFKKKGLQFTYPDLPIHFFTIVLNGQPFIRYHIEIFKQLSFKWHWHIVEGVAKLQHDTAWSLELGGKIIDSIHEHGLSNDGTTEYLDNISKQYPENITIYRKPQGIFWDGKREMVNAPLENIQEECLLWQVDVDELWTLEQIFTARDMFIKHPEKTAAFYWCWYFVGEKIVVSSRNCYSQNPQQEWLRTWRYKPGYIWAAHEPPILVGDSKKHQQQDIAKIDPFLHEETEKHGLIFHHYAYATPQQLKFKEIYYGYKNAESQWIDLQEQKQFPLFLRDYFPWVKDETMVDIAESCCIVPIAQKGTSSNTWCFLSPEEVQKSAAKIEKISPKIVVDGVFFQMFNTGIARVWRSLLEEWVKTGFSKHIIVLDRAGTAPKIRGISYRFTSEYNYAETGADSERLQKICVKEGADLFISTYYTAPISTPSIFMGYDMIPEVLGYGNMNDSGWREKHYGILHASKYITISQNTASDLVKFYPEISPDSVTVAYCGLDKNFYPATSEEINQFQTKHNINKPYFIVVGERLGLNNYKNIIHFFKAFSLLPNSSDLAIVCIGGRPELEPELTALVPGSSTHILHLNDTDLKIAYSGAIALVYPSLYEGFGLPILEAMACGCPVITCHNSSIPEVAGEAALYVNEYYVDELVSGLSKIQNPEIRNQLIAAGLQQAQKFSWSKMAEIVAEVFTQTAKIAKAENTVPVAQVWAELRKIQDELQKIKFYSGNLQLTRQAPAQLKNFLELISAMESSKFWKIRTAWFKLKKSIGLPVDTFEPNIDLNQDIEIQIEQAKVTIAAMQSSKFWKLRAAWFKFKKAVGLPTDNE